MSLLLFRFLPFKCRISRGFSFFFLVLIYKCIYKYLAQTTLNPFLVSSLFVLQLGRMATLTVPEPPPSPVEDAESLRKAVQGSLDLQYFHHYLLLPCFLLFLSALVHGFFVTCNAFAFHHHHL